MWIQRSEIFSGEDKESSISLFEYFARCAQRTMEEEGTMVDGGQQKGKPSPLVPKRRRGRKNPSVTVPVALVPVVPVPVVPKRRRRRKTSSMPVPGVPSPVVPVPVDPSPVVPVPVVPVPVPVVPVPVVQSPVAPKHRRRRKAPSVTGHVCPARDCSRPARDCSRHVCPARDCSRHVCRSSDCSRHVCRACVTGQDGRRRACVPRQDAC
ncbi:hypothetical protein PO909_004567 [Leuciscus waleckii]